VIRSATRQDIVAFRHLLTRVLGFELDESRTPVLEGLLADRTAATHSDGTGAYLARLSQCSLSDP
jgi:hypothetical protein